MRIPRLVTLLAGVSILSGALLLSALPADPGGDGGSKEPALRRVATEAVAAAEGGVTLRFSGTVRAERRADLAFTLGGRLVERRARVGDRVVAGQVLTRLKADELVHALEGAEAGRAETAARAAQAERERRRVARLAAVDAATAEELEQVTANAEALAAARERSETAVQEARRRLEETELRAPYDGTVVDVLAEPGEYLAPGRPVLRLAGDGPVETEVRVPESLLDHVEVGGRVRVEGAGGPVEGRVVSVGRAATGGGTLFPVVVSLGAGSLKSAPPPGATVDVLLERRIPGAVTVPLTALFDPGGSSPAVLAVREGRVQRVRVVAETLVGARVLVHGDLAVGERVVTAGHGSLIDGDPVEVVR